VEGVNSRTRANLTLMYSARQFVVLVITGYFGIAVMLGTV